MTSARRWATVGSSEVNQAEHDDALPVGYGGVDEQSGTAAVVDGPVVGVGVVVSRSLVGFRRSSRIHALTWSRAGSGSAQYCSRGMSAQLTV